MTQKAKGPAEAATSPSHGSIRSTGLKNMDRNNTEAVQAASQPLADVLDLETPICELKTFLFVAQQMWDGIPGEKIAGFPNDRLLTCSKDRSEAISFAILEAQERLETVFRMWSLLAHQAHHSGARP